MTGGQSLGPELEDIGSSVSTVISGLNDRITSVNADVGFRVAASHEQIRICKENRVLNSVLCLFVD
jgi:hypothetical protein